MMTSDAALDRICLMVEGWMRNRRQSASDTLGDIADLLESTGRAVDDGGEAPMPSAIPHLRLVSDNYLI